MPQREVETRLRDDFGLAISETRFAESQAPEALLELRGKQILKESDHALLKGAGVKPVDVAKKMPADVIPDDIRFVLEDLSAFANGR